MQYFCVVAIHVVLLLSEIHMKIIFAEPTYTFKMNF